MSFLHVQRSSIVKHLFENVLIVINDSNASIQAAEFGILMSKFNGSTLHAVYVIDTATLKQLTLQKIFVKEEYDEFSKSLEADGKRYLQYVQELGKAKGIDIETELRSGSVWSEVISYANEIEADVILLGGTTTSDPYQRDMFNSSYGEILLHSNCSVLYVKEEYVDQLYKLL